VQYLCDWETVVAKECPTMHANLRNRANIQDASVAAYRDFWMISISIYNSIPKFALVGTCRLGEVMAGMKYAADIQPTAPLKIVDRLTNFSICQARSQR
jgi:hypothetical protein